MANVAIRDALLGARLGVLALLLGASFATADQTSPEPEPAATIQARGPSADDMAIRAQLLGIFSNVDGLDGVAVTVDDGVVILSGEVATSAERESAEAIAGRIADVALVENRVEVNREVGQRLRVAAEKLRASGAEFLAASPLLLIALAIVFLAWLLARFVGRRERLFRRMTGNPFMRRLARQAIKALIVVGGIVVALELLDARALLGTLAGALGIVGLALGFATRDTVENFIASLLLSLRQPFAPNDHIVIGSWEGQVLRLTSRATILMSFDGNHVRIPNATVYKSTIVNYTLNPRRRFDFTVGVDTRCDLTTARRLAVECLQAMPGVLHDPAPSSVITELADSSIVLKIFGWVDQREASFGKVRSEALRLVKETFDNAGIGMPEPIYNINMRETGGATAASPRPDTNDVEISKDDAIDKQIRADSRDRGEEDLLDPSARKE